MTDDARHEKGLLERIKSIVFCQPDWENMEKLDKPCPGCGQETLYRDPGPGFTAVVRCRECRSEGVTKA